MFDLADRFNLELHWEKAIYEQPGECKIIGAYFCGPVLQIAQQITANDKIRIDFYSQYLYLVRTPYVAELSWGEVSYVEGKVNLSDCFIKHDMELNNVPTLTNEDWLLIDTKNHTPESHAYYLVYPTYVMTPLKDLYKFKA